jgi:hypothetical protein
LCKNLKIDEEKLYDYGIEGYETNDIWYENKKYPWKF